MKCIYCSRHTDYRTRQANHGRCFNCGREYAFEPKYKSLKITDSLFRDAIQKLSNEGELVFTERQLWYFFKSDKIILYNVIDGVGCLKQLISGIMIVILGHLLIFGVLILPIEPVYGLLFVGVVSWLLVVLFKFNLSNRPKIERREQPFSFSDFQEQYLSRWIEVHGKPKMLWTPANESVQLKEIPVLSDLETYSFDHVLVTETAEIARLLVANSFNFGNKCAVLSLDGYPFGMADMILKILRRNPQLIVFALHNASIKGCQTAFILRQEEWFPDQSIKIVDLGMFPRQAQTINLYSLTTAAEAVPSEIQSLLKPQEVTWLAEGQVGELEALSSKRLMRSIYRGMAFTKKQLEEDVISGLLLPIIADWGIILNKNLFYKEKDDNWDEVWNDFDEELKKEEEDDESWS